MVYRYGTANYNAFLPYSAYLRPVVILLRFSASRTTINALFKSLYSGADVLVMFAAMCLVASVLGSILLRGQYESLQADSKYFWAYDQYSDILSSAITSFIYLASTENYPDVVYGATPPINDPAKVNPNIRGLNGLYFTLFAVRFVTFFHYFIYCNKSPNVCCLSFMFRLWGHIW